MNSIVVNPHARITVEQGDPPAFLIDAPVARRGRVRERIEKPHVVAWELLNRLTAPGTNDVEFSLEEVQVAKDLGLIVDAKQIARSVEFGALLIWPRHKPNIEPARVALRTRGVGIVDSLLPVDFAAALGRYCADLAAEGYMTIDAQSDRWCAHNEPVAESVHAQLTPLVQQIVEEPVKASYAYLVNYRRGAVLEKHTDRVQCEYTVSIGLGEVPSLERASAWPLFIEHSDSPSPIEIRLGIGDAVIFRGRQLPHYRNALSQSEAARALFLHFVPLDFAGPLH